MEKAASPACIGTFVLAVMRESQLLVPTPEDLKKVGTESMHFKNFKTNKQLEAEARLCSVILYDDEEGAVRVEIEPYERASKRRSSQRGYVPIPNTILSVPPDAEVVGRGILKAFDINAEG